MSDLISRSALIKHFEAIQQEENVIGLNFVAAIDEIKEQPTAYDVDKVVEELLALNKNYNDGINLYEEVAEIPTEEAIEIVKAGVKNE